MSKKTEISRDLEVLRRWIDLLDPGQLFWAHYGWARDDGSIFAWHRTLWRINPDRHAGVGGIPFFQRASRWATHSQPRNVDRMVWSPRSERFPPDNHNKTMWLELIDEAEADRITMMDLHAPERLNRYLHATYPTGKPPHDPETDSTASHS